MDRPQRAYADAVMVGLSRHLDKGEILLTKRNEVIAATKHLFETNPDGTFTGRNNSKDNVQKRIDKFDEMLAIVLED